MWELMSALIKLKSIYAINESERYFSTIIVDFFGEEALEVVRVPCKVYDSGDLSIRYPIPGTVLRSPSHWPAM